MGACDKSEPSLPRGERSQNKMRAARGRPLPQVRTMSLRLSLDGRLPRRLHQHCCNAQANRSRRREREERDPHGTIPSFCLTLPSSGSAQSTSNPAILFLELRPINGKITPIWQKNRPRQGVPQPQLRWLAVVTTRHQDVARTSFGLVLTSSDLCATIVPRSVPPPSWAARPGFVVRVQTRDLRNRPAHGSARQHAFPLRECEDQSDEVHG
jgi:hypothetical protein